MYKEITDFIGKTLAKIIIDKYDGTINFYTNNGEHYLMEHEQSCCEHVYLEDVIGDINNLIGSPITMAEEVTEDGKDEDYNSSTWTFYKLATVKGYVTLRWFGSSNGWYSETVDIKLIGDERD